MRSIITFLMMITVVVTGFQANLRRIAAKRGKLISRASQTKVFMAKKKKSTSTRKGEFWEAKMDVSFRPTVNDVERISWGKPAKQKGTGSRGVPHRLNQDERFLFDQARRKGFLEITGSGWRSQRREAPLLNSYRSLCDARGQASIVLHKSMNQLDEDELVVDISPLRNPAIFDDVSNACLKIKDGGEIVYQGSGLIQTEDEEETTDNMNQEEELIAWDTRPIYQLSPYYVCWKNLLRSEAKALGGAMADIFDTAEGKNIAPSRKPIGVKPGKSRRSGGYGIG